MTNRNAIVNVTGSLQETPSGDTLQAPAIQATGLSGLSTGRFVGVTTIGSPTSGTFVAGDWVIDQSGNMYVCVTSGTQGVWIAPTDTKGLLATGEETLSSEYCFGTPGTGTGTLRLTYFTARKTETTTQIRVWTATTAAGATPTICRVGLYSIATNGNGTLVASIANDTSLFAAASTPYTRSWSVSYAKVAGQLYAMGILVVTAATAPTLMGSAPSQAASNEMFNQTPRKSAALASQTDLPGSFTNASLGASLAIRHYGAILP